MIEPLPDATADNWVDLYTKGKLRTWLKVGRYDRPVGIWLLMLPALQGVALAASEKGRWPNIWLLFSMALGAALMRAAGCAYNDLIDRKIDRQVARTALRPLAAGEVTWPGVLAYIVALSSIACFILLNLGIPAILLGLASLLLVAAYPFMKRITWWPQAWLGLTFNWGILVGYAADAQRLSLAPILLYIGAIAWTLGYDTLYALQDIEDDAMVGVKSSARRLGGKVKPAVTAFYAFNFVIVLAAAWAAKLGPIFLPFAGLYALHLSWQASLVDASKPRRALILFKSNALAGLILFVGLVAGTWRPGGF